MMPTQELLPHYVRKMPPLHGEHPKTAASVVIGSPPALRPANSAFDANVIMILAVLLCALICALGLNSIVRCVLKCSGAGAMTARHGTDDGHPEGGGGVKKKLLHLLPTLTYSEGLKLPGAGAECTICLSEFAAGERVRVLPKCSHGFHVKCIDRWLAAHSSCPTCRQCLSGTCPKMHRCPPRPRVASGGPLPLPPPPIIVPLDPEGLLIDYRLRY